jgi:hypothetical protein
MLSAHLGRALLLQGRFGDAVEVAAATHHSCGEDTWARIICVGVQSALELCAGDAEAALTSAEEAVALSEETDATSLQGDALVDLVHVLRELDHTGAAGDALERARDAYASKGNVVAERRVQALQAQLV